MVQIPKQKPSESAKAVFLFIFSIILLFPGFFANSWRVADQKWFVKPRGSGESLLVGRMVKSRQDGIFSAGGLMGFGSPNATPVYYSDNPFSFQYAAYDNGLAFGAYTTYNSQIGGQGILFSILNNITPFSNKEKLRLFRALTSVLSALTVTMVILWFHLEFGFLIGMFVLASAVFSQWLVVFGRDLFWSLWAFYLPMVMVMFFLRRAREPANRQYIPFGIIMFIAVFAKCLFNGYDYITTALIMMTVPFFYYSVMDNSGFRKLFKGLLMAILSSCLAILLSFAILCSQIASVEGDFMKGIYHITYSLQKRTHGSIENFEPDRDPHPENYAAGLKSSTKTVVSKYLKGTFFKSVRYLYLIFIFFIMSAFLYLRRNRFDSEKERQKALALIFATWFSILAPLSWFIIFKQHSFEHMHLNYLVWQMPFTFFGFAVCGLAVKSFFLTGSPSLNQQH